MRINADVKIGEKWLVADYGFIFNDKEISMPIPKTILVEIPGTSDVIDLTEEVSGDIQYEQREIMIALEDGSGKDSYFERVSELTNDIHGRYLKVIFSKDPDYYWIGRVAIESAESRHYGTTFVVTIMADPYKYQVAEQLPWNYNVPATAYITGLRKRICPKITCSEAMQVTYLGNTYDLPSGTSQCFDIYLGEGNHVLSFTGSGTVYIEYRGGLL